MQFSFTQRQKCAISDSHLWEYWLTQLQLLQIYVTRQIDPVASYIQIPQDEHFNTYFGPFDEKQPVITGCFEEGNSSLHVLAPEEFSEKWKKVPASLWLQVDHEPDFITHKEWFELIGHTMPEGFNYD